MLAVTVSTGELITIAMPAVLIVLSWGTYVTKLLWDIRTDVGARSARQDERLDQLEADVSELQSLLPRHIPSAT